MTSLRALPRAFVLGADPSEIIPLSDAMWQRFTRVLRLEVGQEVGILPGDGTLIRCNLQHKAAHPIETVRLNTEPALKVTVAQSLPKGDKLDEIVRACTALGVCKFIVFPSDRSLMKWTAEKRKERLARLHAVALESAEVSFRGIVPTIEWADSLAYLLKKESNAVVLSEVETIRAHLPKYQDGQITLVVGPEGGWSPQEVIGIGDRAITLGPRVLRTEFAGPAAAAMLLLS